MCFLAEGFNFTKVFLYLRSSLTKWNGKLEHTFHRVIFNKPSQYTATADVYYHFSNWCKIMSFLFLSWGHTVMVFGLLFYWRLSVFQYCWQSQLFCQLQILPSSKTQWQNTAIITSAAWQYLAGTGGERSRHKGGELEGTENNW